MAKKNTLSPSVMRSIAQTDWSSAESVKTLEQTARAAFGALMAGHEDSEANKARARNYAVGAIVGAFPRAERQDVRPKVEELIARVTRDPPSNRSFRMGDKVVIERFYGHACTANDKPISAYESTIVRQTPTRWMLGPNSKRWIDKRTNIVKPNDMDYLDRARLADGA
jgi:hypothetical protein